MIRNIILSSKSVEISIILSSPDRQQCDYSSQHWPRCAGQMENIPLCLFVIVCTQRIFRLRQLKLFWVIKSFQKLVCSRVSNEGSRRLHNHWEGPYLGRKDHNRWTALWIYAKDLSLITVVLASQLNIYLPLTVG